MSWLASGFGPTALQGTTIKFKPVKSVDVNDGTTKPIKTRHNCITIMKEYESKSLEELCLEDYLSNRRPKGFQRPSGAFDFGKTQSILGPFGAPSTIAATGGLFGSSTENKTFRQQSTPIWFGASTNAFGSTPQTNTLFEKPTTGFGLATTSTTSGSVVNTSTPANSFGANTQAKPLIVAAPQTNNIFGAPAAQSIPGFGSTATSDFGSFGTQPDQIQMERMEHDRRFYEIYRLARASLDEEASRKQIIRRMIECLRQMEADELSVESGSRLHELKRQVEALKEEVYKMETSRDDYRAKLELKDRELLDLQLRLDDLDRMAEAAQHLKDKIDILCETADPVGQYEATIVRKKLGKTSDTPVKVLEDKNLELVQQTQQFEYKVEKFGTGRPQLEHYIKQVAELHSQLTEETKSADRAAFESQKAVEKLKAVQREKEHLILERDALRENYDKLKCLQRQAVPNTVSPSTHPSEGMIPPDI